MDVSQNVIRPADADDAVEIARLVNDAGEGVALQMWQAHAPERMDVWAFAAGWIAERLDAEPYANAWVAVVDGKVAGFLSVRRLAKDPKPPVPEAPAFFAPIFELEALAGDSGYVNVLAVAPAMRGQGVGTRLLAFAERYAGPVGMSLVVSDTNLGARRLYERVGYRVTARRDMKPDGWDFSAEHWLLMQKPPA